MMKILHCIGSFFNGGAETLLVNLANEQVENGYDVHIMIVTTKWDKKLLEQLNHQIKISFVNKPIKSKNPYYLLKLLYKYHRIAPDILHLHGPSLAKIIFYKPKKEKRFVTLHNEVMNMPYSKTVDSYIAISSCVKDAFKKKTGHDNCVICYNGIDFSKIKKKDYYLATPRRMLCIARVLFETKAQDMVVKAYSLLPQNIKDNLTLDFWGDGPDLPKLRECINALHLESHLHALGNKENDYVNQHLSEYDIIIQASHHEGLGLCAIEAMGAKVPLILSKAAGFIEVSENGTYAETFDCGSAQSLSKAIENVFNYYTEACNKACKAYEMALREYSIIQYTEQLSKIYKDY